MSLRKLIPAMRCGFGSACLILMLLTVTAAAADQKSFDYFDSLQKRLIADGFRPDRIEQIYQGDRVFFETRAVSAYFMHNEATINYDAFTRPPWIAEARAYMARQSAKLQQAKQDTGVAPEIITAIILVETKFGRYVGKQNILNILSTMAVMTDSKPREAVWEQLPADARSNRADYNKKADRKAAWAYSELKAFLTYTDRDGFDPHDILGSYAGALGLAQFMPSNILAYGRDGDGDGRIDLFNDADAIYSIAGYLQHYGWKPGLTRDQAYKVVYNYNHSSYYVNTILKIADILKDNPAS